MKSAAQGRTTEVLFAGSEKLTATQLSRKVDDLLLLPGGPASRAAALRQRKPQVRCCSSPPARTPHPHSSLATCDLRPDPETLSGVGGRKTNTQKEKDEKDKLTAKARERQDAMAAKEARARVSPPAKASTGRSMTSPAMRNPPSPPSRERPATGDFRVGSCSPHVAGQVSPSKLIKTWQLVQAHIPARTGQPCLRVLT